MVLVFFDYLAAVICTIVTSVFANIIHNWYDFYIPILLLIAFLLGWFAFSLMCVLLLALPVKIKGDYIEKPSSFYRYFFDQTVFFLCHLGRVKVSVDNYELINQSKKVVVMANHRSKFDPIVVNMKFPKLKLAWIAKRSLFKMPLVSKYMYKCGFSPLDRENPRQAVPVFKKSAEFVKSGKLSIGIYSEGTRNTTSEPILPLKAGAMNLPLKSESDLVIIVTKNTEQIAKRWPLKSTKVKIKVCKVLKYEEYKDKSSFEIDEMVYNILKENYLGLKEYKA